MSLIGIAENMGVTTGALDELIGGSVPVGVATRLGATTLSLQEFVDGGSSVGLAERIGCTLRAVEDLRKAIGREGAIGVLIGLCISSRAHLKHLPE